MKIARGYKDIGFSKIRPRSPRGHGLPETSNLHFEFVTDWDVRQDGPETWYRDKARIKGWKPIDALKKAFVISSDDFERREISEFLDQHAKSLFGNTSVPVKQPGVALHESVKAFLKKQPIYKSISDLSHAVFFCDPRYLSKFLKTDVLPAYFTKFPTGKILVYDINLEYERKLAFLRIGHSLELYKDILNTDLLGTEPVGGMINHHAVSSLIQPQIVFNLLSYIFYPHIHFTCRGPFGLVFIYIFDKSYKDRKRAYSDSWQSFSLDIWDYGTEKFDIKEVLGNPKSISGQKTIFRRFLSRKKFTPDEIENFIEWSVLKYNELAYHLSEPDEFVCEDEISFVKAREYGLSLDRIFRNSISTIITLETSARMSAMFEIADIVSGLVNINNPDISDTSYFKLLLNPNDGRDMVTNCYESMPEPFKSHFVSCAKEVYGDLFEKIKNSVWVKSKVQTNGVVVLRPDLRSSLLEPWDEFVANVMRAIRNAHHGYMTKKNDKGRLGPARHLSLITGEMPTSVSFLGALWAVALLADPQSFLKWKWKPIGQGYPAG